jgi:hypothetical protein
MKIRSALQVAAENALVSFLAYLGGFYLSRGDRRCAPCRRPACALKDALADRGMGRLIFRGAGAPWYTRRVQEKPYRAIGSSTLFVLSPTLLMIGVLAAGLLCREKSGIGLEGPALPVIGR